MEVWFNNEELSRLTNYCRFEGLWQEGDFLYHGKEAEAHFIKEFLAHGIENAALWRGFFRFIAERDGVTYFGSDRLNTYPLFYHSLRIFTPEILEDCPYNEEALFSYLAFGFTLFDETIYRGVRQTMPGFAYSYTSGIFTAHKLSEPQVPGVSRGYLPKHNFSRIKAHFAADEFTADFLNRLPQENLYAFGLRNDPKAEQAKFYAVNNHKPLEVHVFSAYGTPRFYGPSMLKQIARRALTGVPDPTHFFSAQIMQMPLCDELLSFCDFLNCGLESVYNTHESLLILTAHGAKELHTAAEFLEKPLKAKKILGMLKKELLLDKLPKNAKKEYKKITQRFIATAVTPQNAFIDWFVHLLAVKRTPFGMFGKNGFYPLYLGTNTVPAQEKGKNVSSKEEFFMRELLFFYGRPKVKLVKDAFPELYNCLGVLQDYPLPLVFLKALMRSSLKKLSLRTLTLCALLPYLLNCDEYSRREYHE